MNTVHYKHKVDVNQKEMVAAARKIGAKVFVLSNVGEIPDLLILYPSTPSGQLYLIEVKNGKNGLTPTQKKFFDEWGALIQCYGLSGL